MNEKRAPDPARVFAAIALIISQRGAGIVKVKSIATIEEKKKAG